MTWPKALNTRGLRWFTRELLARQCSRTSNRFEPPALCTRRWQRVHLPLRYSATACISSSVIFSATTCITALSLVRSRLLNIFNWCSR